MALGPCLDLATLVGGTGLLRVLVTDVDFHPHQEILETPEPLLYGGADPLVELGTAFDMVASHLDLHSLSPLRSEEHTSELQSRENLVCRLLLEKKKIK